MKNECGKTRKVTDPYEVWQNADGTWTWLVLKKWQTPDKETNNPYARWFCAVITPMTYGSYDVATGKIEGSYDMGDTYVNDIKSQAIRVK